jgi:hypothetical protein
MTFVSFTQSSPATRAPRDTAAFAPSETTVAVLHETVIAAASLIAARENQITAQASETWMEFVKEVPVISSSVTSDPSTSLQVSVWPDKVADPGVILQRENLNSDNGHLIA